MWTATVGLLAVFWAPARCVLAKGVNASKKPWTRRASALCHTGSRSLPQANVHRWGSRVSVRRTSSSGPCRGIRLAVFAAASGSRQPGPPGSPGPPGPPEKQLSLFHALRRQKSGGEPVVPGSRQFMSPSPDASLSTPSKPAPSSPPTPVESPATPVPARDGPPSAQTEHPAPSQAAPQFPSPAGAISGPRSVSSPTPAGPSPASPSTISNAALSSSLVTSVADNKARAGGEVTLQVHLVAFDLETTGFSPQDDRVMELAMVAMDAPPLMVAVPADLAAALSPPPSWSASSSAAAGAAAAAAASFTQLSSPSAPSAQSQGDPGALPGGGPSPPLPSTPGIRHYCSLVQPGMRVRSKSVEVARITDLMLVDAPRMPVVLDEVERFLNTLALHAHGGGQGAQSGAGGPLGTCGIAPGVRSSPPSVAAPLFLLVAHNGKRFDSRFLFEEYQRAGRAMPLNWVFLDTLMLARARLPSVTTSPPTAYNLDTLRAFFGIPEPLQMHRALPDAEVLAAVCSRLLSSLSLPLADLLGDPWAFRLDLDGNHGPIGIPPEADSVPAGRPQAPMATQPAPASTLQVRPAATFLPTTRGRTRARATLPVAVRSSAPMSAPPSAPMSAPPSAPMSAAPSASAPSFPRSSALGAARSALYGPLPPLAAGGVVAARNPLPPHDPGSAASNHTAAASTNERYNPKGTVNGKSSNSTRPATAADDVRDAWRQSLDAVFRGLTALDDDDSNAGVEESSPKGTQQSSAGDGTRGAHGDSGKDDTRQRRPKAVIVEERFSEEDEESYERWRAQVRRELGYSDATPPASLAEILVILYSRGGRDGRPLHVGRFDKPGLSMSRVTRETDPQLMLWLLALVCRGLEASQLRASCALVSQQATISYLAVSQECSHDTLVTELDLGLSVPSSELLRVVERGKHKGNVDHVMNKLLSEIEVSQSHRFICRTIWTVDPR